LQVLATLKQFNFNFIAVGTITRIKLSKTVLLSAIRCVVVDNRLLYFLYCDMYFGARAADCRKILHDGTYMCRTCLLPFEVPQGVPKILNFEPLKTNISKTARRNVTCQL